jgi:hypothetical protein
VREQRWPWLLTAGLMLAAAAATGRSTYLYWLPCRGSMLSSIIRRSVQGPDDGDFTRTCLRQMDGDVALVQPWTSELNIIAMGLLGVAWLTLVVGLGWRWRTKVVAALPGVATLTVALAGAVASGDARQAAARHAEYGPPLMVLVLFLELLAVVALVWILAWQPQARGRHIGLRLVVVLSGTTAFGYVHVMSEYFTMNSFSVASWDTPPGFGYLTAATITISAILTVIMTLCAPQSGADDEPQPNHDSGSLTLA